jgi:hypothetical protein
MHLNLDHLHRGEYVQRDFSEDVGGSPAADLVRPDETHLGVGHRLPERLAWLSNAETLSLVGKQQICSGSSRQTTEPSGDIHLVHAGSGRAGRLYKGALDA